MSNYSLTFHHRSPTASSPSQMITPVPPHISFKNVSKPSPQTRTRIKAIPSHHSGLLKAILPITHGHVIPCGPHHQWPPNRSSRIVIIFTKVHRLRSGRGSMTGVRIFMMLIMLFHSGLLKINIFKVLF